MRLIDADALIDHLNKDWYGDAIVEIQKAPTVVIMDKLKVNPNTAISILNIIQDKLIANDLGYDEEFNVLSYCKQLITVMDDLMEEEKVNNTGVEE